MIRYKTIVVGTDLSERSRAGLEAATRLAEQLGAERVHVVHVVDLPLRSTVLGLPYALPASVVDSLADSLLDDAKVRLDRLEVPDSSAEVTREAVFGIPTAELVKVAERINADLILVTSRGLTGITRFVLGSLASALVRSAHCPVMVVREGEKIGPFESVLAAVDLSPVSKRILDNAVAVAHACGGVVTALSCYEHPMILSATSSHHPPEVFEDLAERHRNALDELLEAAARPGVEVKLEVVEKSPPSQVLVDVVGMTRPDLVVVGTSGRNAWRRALLGSTASKILAEAPCPVLVIPFDAEQHEEPDEG